MVQFISAGFNLASGFVHGMKNVQSQNVKHQDSSFDINEWVKVYTPLVDSPNAGRNFAFDVLNTFSYGSRLLSLGTINLTLAATGLYLVTQLFWKYGYNSSYECVKSASKFLYTHSYEGLMVTRFVTALALFGMGHYLFVAGSVLSYGLMYNENDKMVVFANNKLVDMVGGLFTSVGLFKIGSAALTIKELARSE